jgi:mannose-6-phosphate isomerase-like protein (cupin superfamily)
MPIHVVNLAEKFQAFTDRWSPKIAAELNDSYLKLAKLEGEFVWHHHGNEDELFLVVTGELHMRIREDGEERELIVRPGEFVAIPRGMDHLPSSSEEVQVILLEPKTTLNTGNLHNERTREKLDWI